MGLYNYWEGKLPEPLSQNKCLVCNHNMEQVNKNPTKDAFQYRCQNCNPNVIIEISGSFLADPLYDYVLRDENLKSSLAQSISECKASEYSITSRIVEELRWP